MSRKIFAAMAIISAMLIGISSAEAYSQSTLFGTGSGYAGYNNHSNGAAEASAINRAAKDFAENSSESADRAYRYSEKKVSNVVRDHDEAPNAGYKTNYRYIEKDLSDYNPYTGADSGVNDTKSIYTDDLGRLHFFGKGSLFRTSK